MTRLARTAFLAALTTALCFTVPAAARSAAGAAIDPSRLFNRNAESVFSLLPQHRQATTFAAALFDVALVDSHALQPPAPAPNVAPEPAHLTLPGQGVPAQNISAQAFA